MAKPWLPFYDLGGPINTNMTLASSLDFQLLVYLYASVRPRVWTSAVPPLILQVSSDAGYSTLNPAGVAHLAQYLTSQGFPVEPVNQAQCTVGPYKSSTSLIGALNARFRQLQRDALLSPKFVLGSGGSGAVVDGTLPYHMLSKASWRSAFTGQQATATGPQLELPFFDVTAPFGPGNPNLPADQGLVSGLLRSIYGLLPNLFTGLTIPPHAVVTPEVLPIFGDRIRELGWECDPTRVTPTKGDTKAPSMIRAMNFYLQMAVPYMKPLQLGASCVGSATMASLANQQGSLYF